MVKEKDFYDKSVTQAIQQACSAFSTSQENLEIEVLETGTTGIFGLCKKKAHIRVNLKKKPGTGAAKTLQQDIAVEEQPAPETEPEVEKSPVEQQPQPVAAEETGRPAESPAGPETRKESVSPPAGPEPPTEEVLASIRTDLDRILHLMDCVSEIEVQVEGNTVQCRIAGEYDETILGPEGRTLDSLQYLLRKMTSSRLPEKMLLDIDAGNFRERRTLELQKLAGELADQVKVDGKTQVIPALNPFERRVIHLVLQEDKGVRSRSVGDGLFKKVLIFKPGKGRKPRARGRGRQGDGSAGK
ncbi:RNA-binding protein Jag [hydrothermal vent metagenome]|uniref:RNA-binding protein Jag n=1 Tax=hydrothermal vent metagenome TaxID=652676 RepID=A0A3B0V5Y7_9ZZZZ